MKADVKPFVTKSNNLEAQFYDNSIGPLKLIGNRLICQRAKLFHDRTSLESIEQGVGQAMTDLAKPNLARFWPESLDNDSFDTMVEYS